MNAITITARRTLSRTVRSVFFSLVTGIFLSSVAAAFAFRLDAADGLRQSVVAIWALTVAQLLPFLISLLAMDVWSEERQTRRIDILLSIAVKERDYVIGKSLGVWLTGGIVVLLSLFALFLELAFFAPSALAGVQLSSLALSLFILLLQGMFWSAAASAISAFFDRAFVAATVSILLLALVPRALWQALLFWAPQGGTVFGEMPLDAHVVDFTSGFISMSVIGSFLILTLLSLFVATQSVQLTRLSGEGSRTLRASVLTTIVLAIATAVSAVLLFCRLDATLELPVNGSVSFSPRMRQILAESSGKMTVTSFLPRKDPAFRTTTHFLRMLKRQADSSMGLDLTLRFVDPKWDVGAAERLVRRGAKERSLVLEKGHQCVFLPLDEGIGDRVLASAIQRLALPPRRRDIYWTVGHGEIAFDSYGTWGLSDIARELVRNGYQNKTLDLAADQIIPPECALIVIAGAKDGFSRAERVRLDSYLKSGGRLLVLMDAQSEGGITELLPAWGVRPVRQMIEGARTLSGTDLIASDFADHPISAALKGARVILENPLTLINSAAATGALGADHLDVIPIVSVGTTALVVAVERGGLAGSDLAIRPTRIVIVGDASFVQNGSLAARANANRDLFLNAVAYLSGTDAAGASGVDTEILSTGLDRTTRARFALVSIVAVPVALGLILVTLVFLRRSRR